ncbi:MAG TPA: hypothetical protein VMJ10_00945 [Kofleriaceae bacterium]|nr:hypothetical protein [Kofleriaceae bacterium]
MRVLATIAVIAACGRGDREPAPHPFTLPQPEHVEHVVVARDAGVVAQAVAATPAWTIGDALDRIAAGEDPPRICFAVSANRRRAACATGWWSHDQGGAYAIEIVGETGDLVSEWTYLQSPENGHFDGTEKPDPSVLAEARRALAERKYEPSTAPEVELADGAAVTAGAWTLRRARVRVSTEGCNDEPGCTGSWGVYREKLELRCGRTWREIPNDYNGGDRYGEEPPPSLRVSALDDRHVLTVLDGGWAIEGDFGGERLAQLVDAVAFCR